VSAALPLAMFVLAGLLAGGAVSMHRQGAGRVPVVALGVVAAFALAGGVAWLWPGGE
jgi:hypothetical protein